MHSRKKLSHLAIFKNVKDFFSKKPVYFSEKRQFLNVWEFFLHQSHSTANLL